MTSSLSLAWPRPLALTPEILHGTLSGWGIPSSWGRLDVSVWERLYELNADGEPVTRGGNPEGVDDPPPGYEVEVLDAVLWGRLEWGVCKAAEHVGRPQSGGTTRHTMEVSSTPWKTGGRLKPEWGSLKELAVSWWLGKAAERLLDPNGDGSIDHCARWARDRASESVVLPFGVKAKPRSIMHLQSMKAKDGKFPKTVLLTSAGQKVDITSEADAATLAGAAQVASNRLETARNLLADEALPLVRRVADVGGGLSDAATSIEKLNARTAALEAAHVLLGPDTVDASFARHLATA